MRLSFSSFLLTTSVVFQLLVLGVSGAGFNTSLDLNQVGNSTWFTWNRPIFHLIAPNSWMNDPCAAYYDPNTDEYRIYYQYHNAHVHWGNISFAGAKSDDLIFFEDTNGGWQDPTAIGTDQPYGPAQLGVFSGSAIVDGYKGYPTIMYTSVARLPISWKINYLPLSETQSIAYTEDNGETWIKLNDINPVIPAIPSGWNVTGWRDTLVFRGSRAFHEAIAPDVQFNDTEAEVARASEVDDTDAKLTKSGRSNSRSEKSGDDLFDRKLKAMKKGIRGLSARVGASRSDSTSRKLQTKENGIFTIISSGTKGDGPEVGPKVLLYEAVEAEPGSDKVMTQWNFLGPLFAPAPGTSFSNWSGNWGHNFEMAGYFPLQDREQEMHFITLGTEGGRADHADHWPLWVGGNIVLQNSVPTLVPEMAGVLDYGEVYAINTFPDKDGNRVMLAWTYEDDRGYGMLARGWQGSLLLPRHLSVTYIENIVTSASDDEMLEPSDLVATKNESDSSWTIKTLGIEPIPAALKLRDGAMNMTFEATTPQVGYQKIATLATNHFELEFDIDFDSKPDAKAGIAIRRSEDGEETTNIWYDHDSQAVYVDRSKSSPFAEFNNSTEVAKFRLWEIADSGLEKLRVRLFADGSVVEIYINGRFALTTRIYPSEESTEIGYFSVGDDDESVMDSVPYSDVKVWDGLANAWPSRPVDTSIPLVWDGEPYTNYWPGY